MNTITKIIFILQLFDYVKSNNQCMDNTTTIIGNECTNINTIQLDRGIDWICVPFTEYPEYQQPKVCDYNNKYIPNIFTINNETIGDNYRLSLKPTYSYDDNRNIKYKFDLEQLNCIDGKPHAIINVHNNIIRTPTIHLIENIFTIIIICIFILSFCICGGYPEKYYYVSSIGNNREPNYGYCE